MIAVADERPRVFRRYLQRYLRHRNRSRYTGLNRVRAIEQLEDRTLLSLVTIDPGAYAGQYILDGGPVVTGVSIADLAAGTHNIRLGNSPSFSFDVDPSGNVTSNNPTAAAAAGNSLTFNTTTINIDPSAYTGNYLFGDTYPDLASGPRSYVVLPNLAGYDFWPIPSSHSGFRFDVDAAGQVTSQNAAAAQGFGSTLRLNTTTISIDPGAYTGNYLFGDSYQELASGPRSYIVVPNLTGYEFWPIPSSHTGFRFNVDAAGQVTSQNAAAAEGIGSTLRLNTTTVNIDPGAFTGYYQLGDTYHPFVSGPRSYVLVPNLAGYHFWFTVDGLAGFRFNVDAGGQVISQNADAAQGSGATLRLNTSFMTIDPGDYVGLYSLDETYLDYVTGQHCFALVRNIRSYGLRSVPGGPYFYRFNVEANGYPSPVPTPVNVTIDGQQHTFTLFQSSTCDAAPVVNVASEFVLPILNPTPGGDEFGVAVAGVGSNVLVAAWQDSTAAPGGGAVYLLHGQNGATLRTFLEPSPAPNAGFGSSIAVQGNRILIGSKAHVGGDYSGAVYLFDASTGQLLRSFLNPTPAANDSFGAVQGLFPLAFFGEDKIVVGAVGDDAAGPDAGAVHVFEINTGELLLTIPNPTPDPNDAFGSAVASLGTNIIVAAEGMTPEGKTPESSTFSTARPDSSFGHS